MSERPPIALAHSMGGHILLRALHARPKQFAAAVFSAPMIDFLTRGYPRPLARAACYLQNLFGHADDWVWGMDGARSADDELRRSARDIRHGALPARAGLPRRPSRYPPRRAELGLAGSGLSLDRARPRRPAMPRRSPRPSSSAVRARTASSTPKRPRPSPKRLPNGRYVEFEDAEHEILMENDSIRARFWDAFDGFVGKYV